MPIGNPIVVTPPPTIPSVDDLLVVDGYLFISGYLGEGKGYVAVATTR